MPTAAAFRPMLSWPDFLQAAPYFSSLVMDRLDAEQAPTAAPLLRAAFYFDIFNGEVSNGGVMQYFFNQADYLPCFEQAIEFVGQHPVLAPAIPFMQQAYAAWNSVAPAVHKARDEEDGSMEVVSALFRSHARQFDDLEKSFYAINHDLMQRLNGAMVQDPHAYFEMEPIDAVPAQGLKHVSLRRGTQRLRFRDGFPLGPNLFEQSDGSCQVVWFNRERTILEVDQPGHERLWIHYPSLASSSISWGNEGLEHKTQRSDWYDHGIDQRFRTDGSCAEFTFKENGVSLRSKSYFPDGTVQRFEEVREDGTHITTYWPNGKPNLLCLRDVNDVDRHLACFDEHGVDLAPNGQGRCHHVLGLEEGRISWREGPLVNGFLEGHVVWYESNLDGSNRLETGDAQYRAGLDTWTA